MMMIWRWQALQSCNKWKVQALDVECNGEHDRDDDDENDDYNNGDDDEGEDEDGDDFETAGSPDLQEVESSGIALHLLACFSRVSTALGG